MSSKELQPKSTEEVSERSDCAPNLGSEKPGKEDLALSVQMQAAKAVMRKYRETLRRLADT